MDKKWRDGGGFASQRGGVVEVDKRASTFFRSCPCLFDDNADQTLIGTTTNYNGEYVSASEALIKFRIS